MSTTTEAGRGKRPVATFDHLKKKKPLEIVRYVPIDGGEAEMALNEARMEVERARLLGESERAEKALAAAEDARLAAQSPSAAVRCVFRALGRERYKALVSAHPPKQAEVDQAKEDKRDVPEFDPETLSPELISATMVEPKLTVEEVLALKLPPGEFTEDNRVEGLGWTEAEYGELWTASLLVNNSSRISDFTF